MRWIQLSDKERHGMPTAVADAVRNRVEATLLVPGAPTPLMFQFDRFEEGHLFLTTRIHHDTDLTTTDTVSITFQAGTRVALFVTRVIHVEHDSLCVEVPEAVLGELRQHPRVPVGPLSQLQVRVRRDQRQWTPWVGDLSLGGVRLCFDEVAPSLPIGTLIRIDMSTHHEAASVVGMVVRRTDDAIGVRFQPIAPRSQEYRDLESLLQTLKKQNPGTDLAAAI